MIINYKIFETINSDDYSTWKKDDIVYCLHPELSHNWIFLGNPYKISEMDYTSESPEDSSMWIIEDEDEDGTVTIYEECKLFTKNKNNPLIIQGRFDL